KQLQPFKVTYYQRHGKGLGEDLRADIVADIIADGFISCNKSTDRCHGFSESGKVEVDFILNILLVPCTCSGSTKCTKSVSIIYQQAERVFFLQFCYFFQVTLVSGHSENG